MTQCHRKELEGGAYRELRPGPWSPWDFLMTALSSRVLASNTDLARASWTQAQDLPPIKPPARWDLCLLSIEWVSTQGPFLPASDIFRPEAGARSLTLHPPGLPSAHPPAHDPQPSSPYPISPMTHWDVYAEMHATVLARWLG